MRTRIKVCGMTQESDVVAASHLGVDAIGMIFHQKSARNVSIEKAAKLTSLVKPFVSTVAVVVNEEAPFINEVLSKTNIDLLQFHGDESDEFCASFQRTYYKSLRIKPDMTADDLIQQIKSYPKASAILLDTYQSSSYGGTGEVFDWSILMQAKNQITKKIILAGGLACHNVDDAINTVQPYAIDVNSGVEISPGIKNVEALSQLITRVNQKHS